MSKNYYVDIVDDYFTHDDAAVGALPSLAAAKHEAIFGLLDLLRIKALECADTAIVASIRGDDGTKVFEMKLTMQVSEQACLPDHFGAYSNLEGSRECLRRTLLITDCCNLSRRKVFLPWRLI